MANKDSNKRKRALSNADLESKEQEMAREDGRSISDKLADEDITDVEKAALRVQRRRDFLNRFKLGSHHRMERISLLMGVAVTMLLVLTSISWVKHQAGQKVILTDQAVYTTSLRFSQSHNEGNVVDVFRTADNKTTYVLFKMADVSNMSLDPNKYTVFIKGFDSPLAFKPAGSLFIFGNTGYMGLELHDERGIPKQVIDITIRANEDIRKNADQEALLDNTMDESFEKFDMARIYVNPGGSKAVKIEEKLTGNSSNLNALYDTLIGNARDEAIHANIDKSYDTLDRLYMRAKEYGSRLEDAGFEMPKEPDYMSPNYVVPGGYDLDYKNSRLTDGYISQVVSDPKELSKYLEEQSLKMHSEVNPSSAIDKRELTSVDGLVLDLDTVTPESPAHDVSAKQAYDGLVDTWNDIEAQKVKIQREYGRELLRLDSEKLQQVDVFDSGSSEHIVLW